MNFKENLLFYSKCCFLTLFSHLSSHSSEALKVGKLKHFCKLKRLFFEFWANNRNILASLKRKPFKNLFIITTLHFLCVGIALLSTFKQFIFVFHPREYCVFSNNKLPSILCFSASV